MTQSTAQIFLLTATAWLAYGQSSESPTKFEAVDIHSSAKTPNAFVRTGPARGGRYEVKNATMVDLVRIAYGFDPDKVLGGPSWLEMERFDVIGKVPANSTAETHKQMLQSALEDRFKLVVRKEIKPLPTYALTVGKKHQLKEAAGSEEPGCKPQSGPGGPSEGPRLVMMSAAGAAPVTLSLGPGMTVQYNCRNTTMESFAANLRGMIGASLGPNPILDETALKGNWNFDIKYSMQMIGPALPEGQERISIFTAVEKQLGLKLDERQVPTPVIVVESVNAKPSENPPNVAELLPTVPAPTEFDVASIKPTAGDVRMSRFQMQPGGRLVVEGMPLRFLINRAFNTNNNDYIVGLPGFVTSDRYDVTAKAGSMEATAGPMDMEAIAPMMLALLVDRFKLKYHTEERPVTAFALTAAKHKMKKADPASRTFCKYPTPPAGAPPGSRVLSCQNVTMGQFVERLLNITPDVNWPVLDATEIDGSWDFSLMFTFRPPMMMGPGMAPPRPPGEAGEAGGAMPAASDPATGYTIFEAVEKQLGLKLEKRRRSVSVVVVDHIEQKPTEN